MGLQSPLHLRRGSGGTGGPGSSAILLLADARAANWVLTNTASEHEVLSAE